MNFIKIAAAALTIALGTTVAMAQAPAPAAPVAPKAPAATVPAPTAPTAATAKKSNLKTSKTPEGQACSAEADAKGLHGKPRKAFRAKCMKEKAPVAAKKN